MAGNSSSRSQAIQEQFMGRDTLTSRAQIRFSTRDRYFKTKSCVQTETHTHRQHEPLGLAV